MYKEVLKLAIEIHGAVTGSYDLPRAELGPLVETLKARITSEWIPPSSQFDEACREVARQAVELGQKHLDLSQKDE